LGSVNMRVRKVQIYIKKQKKTEQNYTELGRGGRLWTGGSIPSLRGV